MNHYEEKQAARKERYEQTAAALTARADRLAAEGWKSLESIPFGQPILVGHHSERADRAFRERATGKIDKSVQVRDKAEYYAEKAESVGAAGISSDDPEAVRKLKEKLENLEKSQLMMKAINKIVKNKKLTDAEKVEQVAKDFPILKEGQAAELLKPDFCGRVGFASYALTNNNANIRSTRQRIEQLTRAAAIETREDTTGNGWTLTENKEDNRIRFIFDGKPAEEIRTVLKSNGFRWSPFAGAWQRMLNNAGRYAAEQVQKAI